ncbi:hypothetical protein JAAARDRAFT_519986 [Jaapia argillacea MUCL 33604]|uniref:Uncharacterized protein n=1 Tax=Jaapia argillacea MUCL 33604 TaxID=933084 RepID=A0A067Q413_9AGAM|nr:hypothetical protein JAAARDRAFT_519986 [Jaapia argillacea MUCL 33604]
MIDRDSQVAQLEISLATSEFRLDAMSYSHLQTLTHLGPVERAAGNNAELEEATRYIQDVFEQDVARKFGGASSDTEGFQKIPASANSRTGGPQGTAASAPAANPVVVEPGGHSNIGSSPTLHHPSRTRTTSANSQTERLQSASAPAINVASAAPGDHLHFPPLPTSGLRSDGPASASNQTEGHQLASAPTPDAISAAPGGRPNFSSPPIAELRPDSSTSANSQTEDLQLASAPGAANGGVTTSAGAGSDSGSASAVPSRMDGNGDVQPPVPSPYSPTPSTSPSVASITRSQSSETTTPPSTAPNSPNASSAFTSITSASVSPVTRSVVLGSGSGNVSPLAASVSSSSVDAETGSPSISAAVGLAVPGFHSQSLSVSTFSGSGPPRIPSNSTPLNPTASDVSLVDNHYLSSPVVTVSGTTSTPNELTSSLGNNAETESKEKDRTKKAISPSAPCFVPSASATSNSVYRSIHAPASFVGQSDEPRQE